MKTFVSSKQIIKTLFVLIAFLPFAAMATTYYVSPDGDNTTGLSAAHAWNTMEKVRQQAVLGTIQAGDFILFERGKTFSGRLWLWRGFGGDNVNTGTSTAPITIGAYGTGAPPIMQYGTTYTNDPEFRMIMWFVGVDYYIIQDLNFTDPDVTSNNHIDFPNNGCAIQIGDYDNIDCNHFIIQNNQFSKCGLGVVLNGDNNTVTNNTMSDFMNLVSTPGGHDDYGANAVTVAGDNNIISHNTISDAWAESLDFGFNGGAFEMFNSCNGNKFMYNTIEDCGGIAEFGGLISTSSNDNNVYAYNKIVNCGAMTYCNIDPSDPFTVHVKNIKFYNNVIVENSTSRFSGSNFGEGIETDSAVAHLSRDSAMFQYNGSPTDTVNIVRNNIFQVESGIYIFKTNDALLAHTNNIFKLSGGVTLNATLGSTEISTSAPLFTNTSASDPIDWNFYPLAGSPQILAGVNVSLSPDFDGYTVPSSPNPVTIGPLEYRGLTSISIDALSPAGACAGGSLSIPFTINAPADAGNVFTAQLSNSSGVFGTTIGTLTSTTAGSISVTIPSGTTAGSGYLIRIISSTPSVVSNTVSFTVSTTTPAMPGGITGPTLNNACLYGTNPATYSISAVGSATSYTWTVPGGGTIVSGQGTTSIQVTYSGFTSGSITVTANSYCGSSSPRSLTILKTTASTPSLISGPTDVCSYYQAPSAATYTVGSQSEALSFSWSASGIASISGSPSTNTAQVTFSGLGTGTVSVQAVNSCGSSSVRNLTVHTDPNLPSPIAGWASPCPGTSNNEYSVTDLGAGYTYTWTFPSTVTITAGQGTANAVLSFGHSWSGGNIRVQVTNACGSSGQRTLAATACPPRGINLQIPTAATLSDNLLTDVYPNPSNGNFSIILKNKGKGSPTRVQISNEFGHQVYQGFYNCSNGIIDIHLENKLASGVYFVSYVVNGIKNVKKIIIIQ